MASMDTNPTSFPSRLRAIASSTPHEIAITHEQTSITWQDLDRQSNRVAHALISRGIGLGDLVSIALPNGIDYFLASWGIWKVGATPQPVSASLPQAELNAILAVAGSRFLITNSISSPQCASASIEQLLIDIDDDSPPSDCVSPSWKAPTSGGSTGTPKVIRCTLPATYSVAVEQFFRLVKEDVALIPAPLYHNAPFVLATRVLLAGAHLIIMSRFEPEQTLTILEKNAATFVYLVPTMMNRIAKLQPEPKRFDLSSLQTLWHMAEPCPAWLKQYWIDWIGGDKVWEIYAATEGVASTQINGIEWLAHRGSVGKPTLPQQIRAFSDGGEMLPPLEIGELYMYGGDAAAVTYQYLGAEAKALGDWHSMGDIGYVDHEGYVYLCDRRRDRIIVGGVNIYPAEIEAALLEHSAVQSCAIIGLPCDDRGQKIHAIVQGHLSEQDIMSWLSERLVKYKWPHSIEFVEYSLRDEAGKVRRSQLAAERTGKI